MFFSCTLVKVRNYDPVSLSYQAANYSPSLDTERVVVFVLSCVFLNIGVLSPFGFMSDLNICNHIWMAS